MSSIIEGYNYDIFISYRQKDNKGDRWVSEFVESLKTELESTFKEEIRVYFDINPHDGLLETHDVNASLKEKLRCLVFIPIVSRTYCDPKSFAWEHEFKAFVEQASQDQFGLKVKLPNGNVASRVLPVRIHDLDIADIKECESVLGGVLRGVEFIYKELGIDKPLTTDDDEKKNLNNTKYRIQIIKVTHAIKEIIKGMKAEPINLVKESAMHREPLEEVKKELGTKVNEKSVKQSKIRLLSVVFITAILVIAAIFAYPKIFKRDTLEKLRSSCERISVAVMPFQNMTGDKQWDIWQEGFQEILTTILSNEEGLKVKPAEIIDKLVSSEGVTKYTSLTPSIAGKISRKLTTNIFISGNILKADTIILLNVQLFNTRSPEVLKSFQRQGTKDKIISLIDSLSRMVRDFLIISKLKTNASYDYQFYSSISSVNSIEAYKLMIEAAKEVQKLNFPASVRLNFEALAIDSNYIPAKFSLVGNYIDQGLYEDAKKWCTKIYGQKDNLPLQYKLLITFQHAYLFETPYEQIKYLKQLLDFDNQNPETYLEIGWAYQKVLQYNNAISNYEKSIQIYNRMKLKPFWSSNYTFLGELYHKTGQYKKEKKLYKKAEQDFPDYPDVVWCQCVLALSQNNLKVANEYIDNFKSILKENSASEADISTNLGWVYNDAGINDYAENYLRQALALEPNKPDKLNNLGWFLIDKDQKINEGLTLIDRALEINPTNFDYLDKKGWGLYKKGKYQEALDVLQKSWNIRRKQAIYDHEAFLHLEAAKKAVANKKNY